MINLLRPVFGPGLLIKDTLDALTAEFAQERMVMLAIVVIGSSLLLLKFASQERKNVRTALYLFGFYLISVLVTGLLNSFGNAALATYTRLAGTIFLGASLINFGSLFVFSVAVPALHLTVPRILRELTVILVYVVGMVVLLASRGIDVRSLITTSAIFTAIVGLSLQDTLGNIMSGLALEMENVIRVGDWIKVNEHVGLVKEISWRQTSIETRNWETVVIPNSQLMKSQVLIYGRRENEPLQTRRWVYFNVDYRYAPSDVIEAVNEALRAAPIDNVASEPPINTVLMEFKDSFGHYAVRYWLTNLAVDDPTDSNVRIRIYYALKRAGIPLALPAHSLFLTEETNKRSLKKKEREQEQKLEALRRVDLFRTMKEEELRELVSHLRYAPFNRGEVLTRQGSEAHWLYIITSGEVSVRISITGTNGPGDHIEKEVARLRAGDFFGEMSLMTGAKRSATVVALENVECYRLDKEAFQEILANRPEIAEDISHLLAKRRIQLEAVREGLDAEAQRSRVVYTQGHILDSIRKFFGL